MYVKLNEPFSLYCHLNCQTKYCKAYFLLTWWWTKVSPSSWRNYKHLKFKLKKLWRICVQHFYLTVRRRNNWRLIIQNPAIVRQTSIALYLKNENFIYLHTSTMNKDIFKESFTYSIPKKLVTTVVLVFQIATHRFANILDILAKNHVVCSKILNRLRYIFIFLKIFKNCIT